MSSIKFSDKSSLLSFGSSNINFVIMVRRFDLRLSWSKVGKVEFSNIIVSSALDNRLSDRSSCIRWGNLVCLWEKGQSEPLVQDNRFRLKLRIRKACKPWKEFCGMEIKSQSSRFNSARCLRGWKSFSGTFPRKPMKFPTKLSFLSFEWTRFLNMECVMTLESSRLKTSSKLRDSRELLIRPCKMFSSICGLNIALDRSSSTRCGRCANALGLTSTMTLEAMSRWVTGISDKTEKKSSVKFASEISFTVSLSNLVRFARKSGRCPPEVIIVLLMSKETRLDWIDMNADLAWSVVIGLYGTDNVCNCRLSKNRSPGSDVILFSSK